MFSIAFFNLIVSNPADAAPEPWAQWDALCILWCFFDVYNADILVKGSEKGIIGIVGSSAHSHRTLYTLGTTGGNEEDQHWPTLLPIEVWPCQLSIVKRGWQGQNWVSGIAMYCMGVAMLLHEELWGKTLHQVIMPLTQFSPCAPSVMIEGNQDQTWLGSGADSAVPPRCCCGAAPTLGSCQLPAWPWPASSSPYPVLGMGSDRLEGRDWAWCRLSG